MPRFLAPITVAQEYVTGNETISGSETILGATSGKDSYWTSVSVVSGVTADYGSFVNDVSASYFYGDGSRLTGIITSTGDYLPLTGGVMTGPINFGYSYGPRIDQGHYDSSRGGLSGISLVCSVDYDLNWQAGWITSLQQDRLTPMPLYIDSGVGTSLRIWNGDYVGNGSGVEISHTGITFPDNTVQTTAALPLSGGTLTGKLFGNDADFSNSVYATTVSAVDFRGNGSLLTGVAKLDSPAFVGIPTAPTAPANTNSSQLATTQFVIENSGDRYLTTSSTSLTLNNNNGVSLTASAGLSYVTTQDISIVHSPTQYMLATVVSYNKATGVMVFDSNSHTGAGTFSSWTINVGGVPAAGSLIASNNLSDVASPSAALINLGGFPAYGGTLTDGLTGTRAQFNSVTFTPNAVNVPYELGKVWYDTNKDALAYYNSVSANILHIGQEIQQYVRNATANTILKGDVVRIIGFTNQSPDVVLALATTLSGGIITGVANQDIPPNSNGYIVTIGEVANFDTSRFTAGQDLFLSPLSAGKITNVLPTNPYFAVQVGVCMYSHATNGKLLVYTQYLGTAANTVVGTLGIEQLPTSVGSTVNTVSGLSSRWESVYTTVNSNSSTYVTLTGTQTLKNKTVVDWMTLVRGYNTTPTLLATIATGDVYTYVYNSSPSNITYYRYIATDGTVDAFYTYFSGTSLSGLVASKSITI